MPLSSFIMPSIIFESNLMFRARKVGCSFVKLSILAATFSLAVKSVAGYKELSTYFLLKSGKLGC